MRSDALRRLFGAAASATALAIVTAAIALFEPYVPVLSLGVLYLFAVLPIAVLFGIEFAIPVSVASMLASNWFFPPPVHTFTLANRTNWFALAVYRRPGRRTGGEVEPLPGRSRLQETHFFILNAVAGKSFITRTRYLE